jgi:dipeptidase E
MPQLRQRLRHLLSPFFSQTGFRDGLDDALLQNRSLLLLSNSSSPGTGYLEWPRAHMADFIRGRNIREMLFIPWAGITLAASGQKDGLTASFNAYTAKVAEAFSPLGIRIRPIHREADVLRAVKRAEGLLVGGGNTFHLTHMLHASGIIPAVRRKVAEGCPYIGWSAGANVACPSLRTTNDMPIIEPESFSTFGLVPFQINPHYLDTHPQGHAGETRQMRIEEFLRLHPQGIVLGLREGTGLVLKGPSIRLIGNRTLRVFKSGKAPAETLPGEDIRL